jgi:uncharacterized protein (TIGR03067 family)
MIDLLALQGSWEQVDFEENDVANPPDEYGAPGAITTFNQNHFAVRTAEGALLLEGTFELDAFAKTIDWTDTIGPDAGKTLPAIYKLEGDHFVFIAGDEGAPRPMEFRTGPGQAMRRFVRRS